jgi:hypothetical protein
MRERSNANRRNPLTRQDLNALDIISMGLIMVSDRSIQGEREQELTANRRPELAVLRHYRQDGFCRQKNGGV